MRITVGGRGENVTPPAAPPIRARQLLVDDLDDLLAGVELPDDLLAERPLLQRLRELADDLEVHVGLEQREADLAHGGVDVVLGQGAALADLGQRLLELLGKGVKHAG